jgi:hypothetical protein
VEESEEEAEAAVAPVEVVEVVADHLEIPDPEVPLRPVADLEILPEIPANLVVVTGPSERTDFLPSLMVPVRVPVLAFRGVPD